MLTYMFLMSIGDYLSTIEKYNQNVLKHEQIVKYNIIEDKMENRLK